MKILSESTQNHLLGLLIETKKRKRGLLFSCFSYGLFFVTSNASIAPTTAIATIMPTIPGKRYWSAIDVAACVGCGVAVGASPTFMAVSA